MALPFPLDQFSPTSHVIDTTSMISMEHSGALTHARKLVEERYKQSQDQRPSADADETLESAGVDLLFRGLRLVSASDTEALERGHAVMDALYAALRAELGSSATQEEERRGPL